MTQKRIKISAFYYAVGTSCNALKCHIIEVGLWLYYLQTSLFISIYEALFGIIIPVEFGNKAYQLQYKLLENHNLTGSQ